MPGVYYRYGCILRAGKSGWSTVNPVVMTITLVTQDGVPIDAVHLPPSGRGDQAKLADPGEGATDQLATEALALGELATSLPAGERDLAIVIAHGFTMS